MHKIIPTLFVYFSVVLYITAQSAVSFGKVDPADLAMTEMPSDTAADAMVLFNKSEIFFDYSNGAVVINDLHRRVKLFRRSSFDRADVEIYYHTSTERISKLKATIHLPNGESFSLRRPDFIREDYSDEYKVIKFTFPQVTEGAIIEYSYRETDESIAILPEFYFQEEIPVRWAEFKVTVPEYFKYVSLSNAHNHWDSYDKKQVNKSFAGNSVIATEERFVKENSPAFKEQPYSNNFDDYLPRISMQLKYVQYPQQLMQPFMSDWPTTVKQLYERDDFGRRFNARSDIRMVLNELEDPLALATTQREKAELAYRLIGSHMNFNGKFRFLAEEKLNTCWEKATGSSAEINMILLAVLKELDIEAHPLLVSLRDMGEHVELYPLISQFDHLMILARLDGKEEVIDLGDIHRPIGLPRFSALNNRGWVADPLNPHWVDVKVPQMTQTVLAEISIVDEEMAEVNISARLAGYYGFTARLMLEDMDEEIEGPLMSKIVNVFPDVEFVNREVSQADDIYSPLSMTLETKIPLAQQIDDYFYVSPIVLFALDEGLVDTDERIAPIDMGFPWRERYIAKMDIPEGYLVEELPASQRIRSEDGSIALSFSASEMNGAISINFTVDMKRSLFSPEEYVVIKELFARAIDLQESMIILKKAK